MFERKSLTWPISLAIVMIVLVIGLTVGWILLNVLGALKSDNTAPQLYWTLLSVGTVMFALVLSGVVLYLILSIKQHNLVARQANFIDSVTHELKSPIATLKLYVQTLDRRQIEPQQRQQFYGAMLAEVERLDTLINQLLDVARLSHVQAAEVSPEEAVRIDRLINEHVQVVCRLHRIDPAVVVQAIEPVELLCRRGDIEIVLRNLIDNAVKYSGTPPEIVIAGGIQPDTQQLRLTIENNGASIPRSRRRQVFDRFYRLGSELQRTKIGTGLGLFLVRLVVRRMRGSIQLDDNVDTARTRFIVQLPKAQRVQDDTEEQKPVHDLAIAEHVQVGEQSRE